MPTPPFYATWLTTSTCEHQLGHNATRMFLHDSGLFCYDVFAPTPLFQVMFIMWRTTYSIRYEHIVNAPRRAVGKQEIVRHLAPLMVPRCSRWHQIKSKDAPILTEGG